MTGRTQPQLSSQNIAGFSNISDFPSNSYKHKLYRQIRNVLTTSLAIAQFVCTGSVPHLICSSFYTQHVIITFGKSLWRCQTHSLKSISHHNYSPCIKTCTNRYIDISASDKTFILCVALPKCSVAPAGNKFSTKVSCFLFEKIYPCMIFYVCCSTAHCIYVTVYWGDKKCQFAYTKIVSLPLWGCRGERSYGSTHSYARHCMEVSS